MSQHTRNMERKRLEREQKRREDDAARAQAEANAASSVTAADAEPEAKDSAHGGGAELIPPQAQSSERPSRPQPLTPDLIPEPELIDATGELTADELNDLAQCERAFIHANEAAWMKGKAAHAVRDRRLYRQGGRTWAAYCEEEIGESESDVNRQIQEWPLAAAVSDISTTKKAAPASHIRALLPLAKWAGEANTAAAYVKLRAYAAEHGHRVTAAALTSMVERFSKPADPLPVAQFGAAVRAIAPQASAKSNASTASEQSASAGHPNLGDQQESASGQSPGLEQAEAPQSSQATQPAAGHPNLGDTAATGTGGAERQDQETDQQPGSGTEREQEDDTVVAEIIDESRALALLTALMQAEATLREDLREATPATLKAISEAARKIVDVSESFL